MQSGNIFQVKIWFSGMLTGKGQEPEIEVRAVFLGAAAGWFHLAFDNECEKRGWLGLRSYIGLGVTCRHLFFFSISL